MKKAALVLICALIATTPATALDYSTDRPLAFTYTTGKYNHGYRGWKGCGPVQCTITGSETEQKAFDYLTQDDDGPWEFLGTLGRCNVYSGRRGAVESWDNSPQWVADKAADKC